MALTHYKRNKEREVDKQKRLKKFKKLWDDVMKLDISQKQVANKIEVHPGTITRALQEAFVMTWGHLQKLEAFLEKRKAEIFDHVIQSLPTEVFGTNYHPWSGSFSSRTEKMLKKILIDAFRPSDANGGKKARARWPKNVEVVTFGVDKKPHIYITIINPAMVDSDGDLKHLIHEVDHLRNHLKDELQRRGGSTDTSNEPPWKHF